MLHIRGKWYIKSDIIYLGYSTTNNITDSVEYSNSNEVSWNYNQNVHYYIIQLGSEYDVYNITYEMNNSLGKMPYFYHTGVEIELPVPIKHKYLFVGWTGSNGSIPQINVKIPQNSTGNKYYVANFEENPFTGEIYTISTGNTSAAIKVDGYDSFNETDINYVSASNKTKEFPFFYVSYNSPYWKVTAKSDNVYYSDSQIKPISEWDKLDTLSWSYTQNVQYYFVVK